MNLAELQNKIHAQNKEKGWWDNPRSFSMITNLGVSEASESLEGNRKGLIDNHLESYPMDVVEIADLCIRTLDYLGSENNNHFCDALVTKYKSGDFQYNLAALTMKLMNAWYMYEIKSNKQLAMDSLRGAISHGFLMITDMGYDPIEVILEKVEYNKHRADHKRENRAKQGGKKY
ncbi:hypothetical protein NVP1144O_43 [Vibrio phage 1.144.O._10N.286.45.B3]|nr:hypothetical protein NVP1144O_43 [Vibrio phage 1.144.O._10N.286.45.B3]